MNEKREVCTFGGLVEMRAGAGEDDPPPVIAGHAAIYNALSEDLGGFKEKIEPGAFAKTIGDDIRALFNHDRNIVLGRTRAKTLRVGQDDKGLTVEIDPPDTSQARDVVELIRRRDLSQMSIGFQTLAHKWEENPDTGEMIRTLLEVRLFDVSVVTIAAYPQTQVGLRSLAEWHAENGPPPDFQKYRRRMMLAGA